MAGSQRIDREEWSTNDAEIETEKITKIIFITLIAVSRQTPVK